MWCIVLKKHQNVCRYHISFLTNWTYAAVPQVRILPVWLHGWLLGHIISWLCNKWCLYLFSAVKMWSLSRVHEHFKPKLIYFGEKSSPKDPERPFWQIRKVVLTISEGWKNSLLDMPNIWQWIFLHKYTFSAQKQRNRHDKWIL